MGIRYRINRRLEKGEVELRVGNGARMFAVSVGALSLSLPSGLILELENCYHVPRVTKNIISISALDAKGFKCRIKNNSCIIYFDNVLYGKAHSENGLYVHSLDKKVYNIDNTAKRAKTIESNQTYLWHCRLIHINIKRIKKLFQEGVLDSFDLESFENCKGCLLGKMIKQPISKLGERASDLLGLIHTDVCGQLSTPARQGYRYFITFTDDFSRYGYIYLMSNKSESFEKFKEFE